MTIGDEHYDVVVIGGGPAGSICARVLARRGHSVLLLERSRFPRFHIGESLLTYAAEYLDQLGILDRLSGRGFVVKRGVELSSADGACRRIDFRNDDERRQWTFQVERAEFDRILLDEAVEAGATVRQEARVTRMLFTDGRATGVRYTHGGTEKSASATYVADASGHAGVIARHLGLRKPNNSLRMVAVFKHFGDVDERNNPGVQGDIQLGNHPDGWVWAIPIRQDVLSVGAVVPVEVMREADPSQVFDSHVQRLPRVHARLKGAAPVRELTGESDYCYYTDTLAGPGYFLLGDSACFMDPIFSGGVFLAMTSGGRSAELMSACLGGDLGEAEAQRSYERFYKTGYDTYFRLIRAFYDNERDVGNYLVKFFADPNYDPAWVNKYVVRLLNGDFWSRENFLAKDLRKNSSWDLFEEFEPDYRCPVFGASDLAASS